MGFRMKRRRPGSERDRPNRPKKKGPGGPAKRTAKKLPERRAMIAAESPRKGKAKRRRKRAPLARFSGAIGRWSRRADRLANRGLERAYPALRRGGRAAGAGFDWTVARIGGALAWAYARLRRPLSYCFRGLGLLERGLR